MTTPTVKTFKRGNSRFYVHPDKQFGSVPGVTSILDMLPKPWLKFWSSKLVAETAVQNLPAVIGMCLNGDEGGAIDYLKRAPLRNTTDAAEIGTDIHLYFERMSKGEKLGRVHPNHKVYIDHLESFFKRFQPDFLHVEATVWSETHGYAGSFDGIPIIKAKLLDQEEDGTIILDLKTTRSGIHDDVAIQLNAYANADYLLSPDGSKAPLPELNGAAVLHVRPEGWKFVPVRLGEDIFSKFLALKEVFYWERDTKGTVIGDPIYEEMEEEG